MRLWKSDDGVVPVKTCNAVGGKAITTITAMRGDMRHAQ